MQYQKMHAGGVRETIILQVMALYTTPDCNLPTKEVSQCNYSWELCLLFSDYSPKLEDTYYSQIIPGINCQSLPMALQTTTPTHEHNLLGVQHYI